MFDVNIIKKKNTKKRKQTHIIIVISFWVGNLMENESSTPMCLSNYCSQWLC